MASAVFGMASLAPRAVAARGAMSQRSAASRTPVVSKPRGVKLMSRSKPVVAGVAAMAAAAPRAPLAAGRTTASRASVVAHAAGEDAGPLAGLKKMIPPQAETAVYIAFWYLLNVKFNIINKQIYNYFPYPWFVSCVHLIVGLLVMSVFWGTKVVPFEKPDGKFLKDLTLPAFLHAFGHCLTNVSFAAVAVSFTHTIKTLEPVFSAIGSYAINGVTYPLPVYLSLIPIMGGVALASASELSFNWLGFGCAMSSNIAFAGRAIFSKKLMSGMSPINLYNYVTIVALAMCLPPMFYFEGATLAAGMQTAIAKVGAETFYWALFNVGLYYHLYNQVAYMALGKVEPVTHAVANVGKRIFVIGFSILAFGNQITAQTAIGSSVAIFGAFLYSYLKATTSNPKSA